MPFMADDEFIILMDFDDHPRSSLVGPVVTPEDALRLREVGVKTAMKYVQWHMIEPERGVYDWDYLDKSIEKWTNADIKVMLNSPMTTIQWAPDNWYPKNRHELIIKSSLSAFNKEAQDYQNNFLKLLVDRYPKDKVCAINGQLTQGETVYHNEPAYYDDAAREDYAQLYGSVDEDFNNCESLKVEGWLKDAYVSMLVKQQMVLSQTPHKDIWTALHPAIRLWKHLKCNGNKYYFDIFQAFRRMLPDSQINQILYTYWPHGTGIWKIALEDASIFGIKLWVGSEYCEGMKTNLSNFLSQNLRGFITSPIHPFTPHKKIEQWMLDIISTSHNQWQASRKI